jgi:hypothetical protein
MARIYEDTGTWHTPGVEMYHLFSDCTLLKAEREEHGIPAIAKEGVDAGSLDRICTGCRRKYEGIPAAPSKEERVPLE